MRKRVLILILAALALSGVMAGTIYQRWLNSPRYALQQIVLAIKSKDMDKLFNYMDIKEIFNNILESSTQDLRLDEKSGDEWTRFSRQLGRKFARQLLPKLFDNFEKQIRGAMESYLRNLDNSQILALAAAVTTAGFEVQGEEALVTLKDPKTGRPLRLRMRRAPPSGAWRVVAINYDDFKHLLKKEILGITPPKDNV